MKKILFIFSLAILFTSCGDTNLNTEAFCDGEILIPFKEKKSKDWGFINLKGEIVVEPEFDKKPSFAVNGIALIREKYKKKKGSYYRYIKITDGRVKKSYTKWDLAGEFHDGLAPVRNDNGKVKFINENFHLVFTAQAEEVAYFNEGLAAFKNKKGKWGFFNHSGKVAIKAQYDFVRSGFCEGHAIVGYSKKGEDIYKIIDKEGKVVLNCKDKYDDVISISEGLIMVEDGGFGFIDLEGTKVIRIDKDFEYITAFMNGYATFYEDNEWGLIDKEGEKIFNAKFEKPVYVFDDRFWYKDDGEWGVKDLDGKDIIEPEFRSSITPYPFFCSTSIVGDGRDDMIFIDKKGVEFGKAQYDRVAELDYKLLTNNAWNETFESDLFDAKSLSGLISTMLLEKPNGVSLLNALGIQQGEVFSEEDKDLDYSLEEGYRYYAEDSKSFSFNMFEINYDELYGDDYNDYDYEDEYSYYDDEESVFSPSPFPREDDPSSSAYMRRLREKYVEREAEAYEEYEDYEDYYDDEYGNDYGDYDDEDEVEEIVSKYPKDSPSGISSVEVSIKFDDYMGVSSVFERDEVSDFYGYYRHSYDYDDYYGDDDEKEEIEEDPFPVKYNNKAKVQSISLLIDLNGRGYGKSNMLAEEIAKKWKLKCTNVLTDKKKGKSYSFKASFALGTVSIRTLSSNTISIKIYYSLNPSTEDDNEVVIEESVVPVVVSPTSR